MSSLRHEVRPGAYYDSVILMQLQKSLAALDGVEDAGVVMATPANKEVLTATGFDLDGVEARPDDLLIMVRGVDDAAAERGLAQVDALLKARRSRTATAYRPRSLAAAANHLPQARWVLISVPGRYAAGVADEALDLGKHVFLYSDNVSLEDEIRLKQKGAEKGLLLMGPDCGTAIVNGTGLGFANRVRRGAIGVVAASGTGLQAVTADIHNLDAGISQGLGTGGRDLKDEVGGTTALQGLDLLARDPQTAVIVLVSKPPSPTVAARLLAAARRSGKPVVVNFIGYPPPARRQGNLYFTVSLSEAAERAVALLESGGAEEEPVEARGGFLRGIFSGGTLAAEALLSLQGTLAPLFSNIPLRPEQALEDVWHSRAHTIIDLGEDEFTQGRLHPMMDNDLRLRRLRQEAADPETGLILLDVVLGEGAHADPAGELAPVIADAVDGRPELEVVCLVLGTDEDPQEVKAQVKQLRQAGARVFRTVAETTAYVAARLLPPAPAIDRPVALDDFDDGLAAINVGLDAFYDSLVSQGGQAVQVDWRPPAGGNQKMMDLLARLKAASSGGG